jgi:hypothetical protein
MRSQLSPPRFASMLAGLFALAGVANAESPPAESEPILTTKDFRDLPPATGDGYRIEAKVPVSGYQGQFTIKTDLGDIRADGTGMLRARVAEVPAVIALDRMSSSDVFVGAVAKSAQKGAQSIGKAITNPVDTIEAVPAGIGRFFGGVTKKMSGGAPDVSDALGISAARRDLAHKVGVDPYSSNPLVRDRLDTLSKAAFAGGVSIDVTLAVVSGGAATAVSFTKTVSDLAWELPPEDIRERNEAELEALGVKESIRDAFLANGAFTPTLALSFVEALKTLGVREGAGDFTLLAAGAGSETEARFFVGQLRMAGAYKKTAPIERIDAAGRVGVMRAGNKAFVPIPVDYVSWTAGIKAAVDGERFKSTENVAWFAGALSPTARKAFEAQRWTIVENAPRS